MSRKRSAVKATGDCYEAAALFMFYDLKSDPLADCYTLCHGTVTGQGPIAGQRIGHGWVEWRPLSETSSVPVFVIDRSNGRNVIIDRDDYYRIGKIELEDVRRYTRAEMIEMLRAFEHYGPWPE